MSSNTSHMLCQLFFMTAPWARVGWVTMHCRYRNSFRKSEPLTIITLLGRGQTIIGSWSVAHIKTDFICIYERSVFAKRTRILYFMIVYRISVSTFGKTGVSIILYIALEMVWSVKLLNKPSETKHPVKWVFVFKANAGLFCSCRDSFALTYVVTVSGRHRKSQRRSETFTRSRLDKSWCAHSAECVAVRRLLVLHILMWDGLC